jgi:hypothetical protein
MIRAMMRRASASRREGGNVPGVDLIPAIADVFAWWPARAKFK